MKRIIFTICTGLLLACNNNAATKEAENDTLQGAAAGTTEAALLQNSFPQLFAYLKEQDGQFVKDSFYLSAEGKLSTAPAQPLDEENLLPYKKLLIYNADSTKAIDLYSYNYIISNHKGMPQLESAEPDTEIGLINYKNKTRKRIFFSGPSYAVWDGAWVDENLLLLAGAEVEEQGKITPFCLRINLADSSIETFTYKGILTANMQEFVNTKIKKQL